MGAVHSVLPPRKVVGVLCPVPRVFSTTLCHYERQHHSNTQQWQKNASVRPWHLEEQASFIYWISEKIIDHVNGAPRFQLASGNSFGPVANSEHRIVSQLWWARRWAWALDLSIAVVENSAVVWIRLGSGRSVAFVSLALSTGRSFWRFARHLFSRASGNSFGPVANSKDWIVSQSWWARRWAWELNVGVAVVEKSTVAWISLGSGRSVAVVSLINGACWSLSVLSTDSEHEQGEAEEHLHLQRGKIWNLQDSVDNYECPM